MKIRVFWNMIPCIVVNIYQNFGEVCYLALNYYEDGGSKLLQMLVNILQSTRCHMSYVRSLQYLTSQVATLDPVGLS